MNNKNNKTNFPMILLIIAAGILGVTVYFVTASKEKEATLTESEKEEKVEQQKPSEQPPHEVVHEEKHIANEQQDIHERPPAALQEQQQPGAPHEQGPKNAEELRANANARIDEAMKKQVPIIYEDLFKELNLPEKERQQVENHLVKTMKSEADFNMKLLDPNVAVDDILKEQDRIAKEKQSGLTGVLKPNEQELVTKHEDELPKKALKKNIEKFVESLNLPGDKENAANALERAMLNADQGKKVGQYTAQDINDLRKPFVGTKPGDPEFMRASIEASSKRISGLLKDLEQLPKEQYEAIKKQMEAPIEMMRQGMQQQQARQGSR